MHLKWLKKPLACLSAAVMAMGVAAYLPTVEKVEAANTYSRQVEALDRGLVAVKSGNGIFLSWRLLGTESYDTAFNVYRNGTLIAQNITDSTNYYDASGTTGSSYQIRSVVNGVEKFESDSVSPWSNNYLDVPINKPGDIYSANDATVADVDGDGQYEIILKWDPSDAKDNSQSGTTSNVYIDCYEMDGTQKWRIDLGRNIRAGAHYTQFIAYDFDGDGKAEVAMKTADATVDGKGNVIGDANADYRNSSGYILSGPEYLTMFSGETGEALTTIDYIPARGTVSSWGDSYGNRVDRFLAGVAYLDGKTPSLIMCRGYYTRAVIVAYDFKNNTLTRRWTFDSNSSGNSAYAGQGNHSLSVADVDGDGYDEIVYGSAVIDQDGSGLYSTGQGHGDALHVGDFDPDHEGLEIFQVHETKSTSIEGVQMRDANTGTTLWHDNPGTDVGRGLIVNIGPDYYPYVATTSAGNFDKNGNKLSLDLGKFGMNFAVWWDGDLYREGLDRNYINKYNYNTKGIDRLLTASDVHSNNGTKATPSLSADIFGDWREEVIWPLSDDSALRIYTTTDVTEHKLYTFMHDTQYRAAIAWQNVAYNQPPHPSFYMGEDMPTPTQPNVYTVGSYKQTELNIQPKTGANIAEGKYMIQGFQSGNYLNVYNGTAANGTNVQMWSADSASKENTWYLKSAGDGYYYIYSCVGDGSYMLDLDYGKTDNGTNIQIYQNTNSDAQKFKFVYYKSGLYTIATKATTDQSNLDVYNHSKENGANVCQWEYTGNSNQLFKLIPVDEESSSQAESSSNADSSKADSSSVAQTETNIIYCSPNGGGDGSTKNNPTDVNTAISSVKTGQTIYLLGGTYKFDKTIVIKEANSGTASAYKTISAYPGENVVWDFSAMSVSDSNIGVVLDGSYWHFYGFEIANAGDNGMLLSGNNNKIEMMVFNNNQDSGLQISRYQSSKTTIDTWPSNNYILNCTSKNNCDEAKMENADGFAAKLTCGEGNVFDGCMAYNNSDDGYDLYAKDETGPIGVITIKNCLAFRNGYTEDGRGSGDGNGFKLGGDNVGSAHVVYNCLAFENLNCGFTDNKNPDLAKISDCTAVNNGIGNNSKPNFSVYRCTNCDFDNLMSYYNNSSITKASDKYVGTYANGVYYNKAGYYIVTSDTSVANNEKIGTKFDGPSDSDFISTTAGSMGTDFHKEWRNSDGSINTNGYFETKTSGSYSTMGYRMSKSADDTSSSQADSSSKTDSSSKADSSSRSESTETVIASKDVSDFGWNNNNVIDFNLTGYDTAKVVATGSCSYIKLGVGGAVSWTVLIEQGQTNSSGTYTYEFSADEISKFSADCQLYVQGQDGSLSKVEIIGTKKGTDDSSKAELSSSKAESSKIESSSVSDSSSKAESSSAADSSSQDESVVDADLSLVQNTFTLDGMIGANFDYTIPSDYVNGNYSIKVTATSNKNTITVDFDKNKTDDNGAYRFTIPVASCDITETYQVKLVVTDSKGNVVGTTEDKSMSVNGYLGSYRFTGTVKQRALASALQTYGYYSQELFNNDAVKPVNKVNDVSDVKATTVIAYRAKTTNFNSSDKVTLGKPTLLLEAETTIRFYVTNLNSINADNLYMVYEDDGKTVKTKVEYSKSEGYYADIPNIGASKLSNMYSVHFESNGTQVSDEMTFGAYSFIYNTLFNGDDNTRNVARALYKYSLAAEDLLSA